MCYIGVVIESTHFCMAHRGVRKLNASLVTQSFSGLLADDKVQQEIFLQKIDK